MRKTLMMIAKIGVGGFLASLVWYALLTDKFDVNGKLLGLVEEGPGYNVDDFVSGLLIFGLGMVGAGFVGKLGLPAPTVKA